MPATHVFTSVHALPGKEIAKGVTIHPLAGAQVMFTYVELAPHAEVPSHSHPHEQLGVMLEGELEMQVGGERRMLKPGDAYVIPGGVPHGARTGGTRALVLDIFHPLREDYLALFPR